MTKMDRFEDALSTFHHGGRYDKYLPLARKGLNAMGNDAERVFAAIMDGAPGKRPNPSKVRSAIAFALEHDRTPTGSRSHGAMKSWSHETDEKKRERIRALLPSKARGFVQSLADRPGAVEIGSTFDEIIRASDADLGLDDAAHRRNAVRQIRALDGGDGGFVWAGTILRNEDGTARKVNDGWGVLAVDKLIRRIGTCADPLPTHVSLNALTGELGTTKAGNLSLDCIDAVRNFNRVLIEFDLLKTEDGLPSTEQTRIVGGLIDFAEETGKLSVACVTWTGGKSLHVVVRVPDGDMDAYRKQCSELAKLFASADDPRLRIDLTGWGTGANAITHVRLAGAVRPETGLRQRLLFVDE